MKKNLVYMMIILIIILFSGISSAQDTMKIVYFNNFPPFSWEDNQNRLMKGILIDVLNEAIQNHMGIRLSHKGYPWLRAQKMVESGQADAFVTIATLQRRKYTEISREAVLTRQATLFAQKGHDKMEEFRKIETLSDLKGFKLLDYIGNGWAEKNLSGFKRDMSSTLDSVFKKLAHGRGELTVQNSQVSNYTIKELGLTDKIVEIQTVLASDTFHLCIGKKSPYVNILADFDETIRKMQKSGILQTIYDQYK